MRVEYILGIAAVAVIIGLSCGNTDRPGFGQGGTDLPDGTTGGGSGDDSGMDTSEPVDDTGVTVDDTGDSGEPVITGTGYGEGDTCYDLDATTQAGSPWSLHDMYGSIVVLVVGNMYDASMVEIMEYLDDLEGDYDGLVTAAFVGMDEDTVVADQDDAARLAIDYGVTVVMYDSTLTTWQEWAQGAQLRTYLIDREMVIQWTNTGATSAVQLRDKIDDIE